MKKCAIYAEQCAVTVGTISIGFTVVYIDKYSRISYFSLQNTQAFLKLFSKLAGTAWINDPNQKLIIQVID